MSIFQDRSALWDKCKILIEEEGVTPNGREYFITLTPMRHRCGYVAFKGELPVRSVSSDLRCHGGITYSDNEMVGFDCAHHGDEPLGLNEYLRALVQGGIPVDKFKAVSNDLVEYFVASDNNIKGEVRSLDFVRDECHKIAEQLEF